MRVLEIARQFYPKIGGIESCVLNLARGLVARGHHVEVVTLDRDLQTRREILAPDTIDSISIHRIPYFGPRRYPIAPSWFHYAEGFDVIHIHAIDFFVDSATLYRRIGFLRQPVVVTTHGGIFHTSAFRRLKNFYWKAALKRSLREVAAVVAVSKSDAELFGEIVSAEKLITVPNGVDPIFRAVKSRRVRGRIVCMGRVNASKRIDSVVRLVANLLRDLREVELVIAGPDERGTADRLRALTLSLGIQDRVRIIGALSPQDLALLVGSAHVFVSAAHHEGFGITTVETLSAGVPVLVTHTGIHDDIVTPERNGWFWSGSPDESATETLRKALLLPDARLDAMQLAARKSAAPFDWDVATDKYEQILASAYRENPR